VPAAEATEERTGRDHGAAPNAGYAHEHRPLRGYAVLTSTFATLAVGSLVAARLAGRELPDRYGPWDVLTTGVATHKLSRLISKDKVTSFLRAPFTRYQEGAGHGELSEEPRGEGLRFATGELLVCPYCLGQWVATGFAVGMVTAPRFTRMAAYVLTAETISDFLQLGYLAAEERTG
jgi:hypothetical protein